MIVLRQFLAAVLERVQWRRRPVALGLDPLDRVRRWDGLVLEARVLSYFSGDRERTGRWMREHRAGRHLPHDLPRVATAARMVRVEAQAARNVAARVDPAERWQAERLAAAYGMQPGEALRLAAGERERDRLTVGAARGVRL